MRFNPVDTFIVRACQSGGPDANGQVPERMLSDGTGAVVATGLNVAKAATRLADPRVAYVHVRSARNNCFQVRVDR